MQFANAETVLKAATEMTAIEIALRALVQDLQKRTHTLENRMYKVERQPVGEQPDGTFAVPAMPKNGAGGSESPAPSRGYAIDGNGSAFPAPCNGNRSTNPLAHSGWALAVREQTNALIDVYADCCRYASERHSDVVSRDDVRAILMNRLISGGRR